MSDAGLPKSDRPEDVGFSAARLKLITEAFRKAVDSSDIPGAVVLIARQGKVAFLEAFGYRDREKQAPMSADAIFRIASMTKPITSVALMMLAEEGKVHLAYPVSAYLPELRDLTVGVEAIGSSGKANLERHEARREMTIQDLLRHTSGLTYGFLGSSLVKAAYNEAKIDYRVVDDGMEILDTEQTNAELITKLSKLPLAYHPGTTWEYGVSTDVLGRVVEVVAGVTLDRFIAERISQPLGLRDTDFSVPEAEAHRIAEPQVNNITGKRPPMANPRRRPKSLSGGAFLISTAADYVRFCQMLLNGGELDGVRVLSPKTIALMTSDHLPPEVGYDPITVPLLGAAAPTAAMGHGFGLGFAVRKEQGRNPLPGSVGDYSWSGAWGTTFWIDPHEQLIAILMLQVSLAQRFQFFYDYLMRELVYRALIPL